MMQLWQDERQFLQWTGALVFTVIFSILVQTYLLPYGLALLAAWLLFWWWRRSDITITPRLSFWLVAGSLVFVAGLVVNLFNTQNVPVSLHEAVKWLAALVVFLTAVRFSPQKPGYSLYWLSFLIIFLVLGSLSLLTWIVPALRILPDMNFLYATFGHNHFSAMLILITPWLVLGHTVWPSSFWKWALAGWAVWLFSTFSRLGLVVGVVQLAVLAIWLKSDKVWHTLLIKWLIAICCFALAWFGLQVVARNQSFCAEMSYLSERICKTNQPEQRPEYWRQAVEVINQKPLVGTGLGTFSAVSLQHRKAPGSYAAHAHNDYLEWIAEAGWWGVFVTVCLWGIWWKFRPRTADWFVRAVWLSIGSVLTLGLFDFDLQFVVFLFAVLVGLGWLIGFQQRTSQKTTESVWLKILVSFITIVIVGWAALFLALNLDWQQGNKQLLAKYGHYYPAHSFLLVKLWPELHEAKRSELLQLWQRDYRVLDFLLDEQGKSFDSVTTSQMLQHFYAINPWSRLKYDLVALQLQHNELESARQTLQGTDAFADTQQARFDVTFKSEGDQLRWRQAQQYLALAEKELERDNGLQVVADVSHAAQFEPWILDDPNTKYCSGLKNWVRQKHNNDPVWLAAWSEQLKLFDSINPWLFGSCKTDLSQMALEQLKVQLQHNRCSGEICKIWSYRALRWSENELWVQSFLTRLRVEFPTQEF